MQEKSLSWICYKGFQIPRTEKDIQQHETSSGRKFRKVPPKCGCSLQPANVKGIECFSLDRVNAALQAAGSQPLSDDSVLSMLNLLEPNRNVEASELSVADIEKILNDIPPNDKQLDSMPQTAIPVTGSSKTIPTQANSIRPKSAAGKKRKAKNVAATDQPKGPREKSVKRRKESITNLAGAAHVQPEGPFVLSSLLPETEAYTSQNVLSGPSNFAAAFDHEALDRELQNMQNIGELAAEALEWLKDDRIEPLPVPIADLPLSSNSQPSQNRNDHVFSESLDAEGLTVAGFLDAEQEPSSLSQAFASGGSMTMGIAEPYPYTGPLTRVTDTDEATGADIDLAYRAEAEERVVGVYPNGLPSFL